MLVHQIRFLSKRVFLRFLFVLPQRFSGLFDFIVFWFVNLKDLLVNLKDLFIGMTNCNQMSSSLDSKSEAQV